MMYYQSVDKRISLKRYNRLTKGMNSWDIALNARVYRKLKHEVLMAGIEPGIGILAHIEATRQSQHKEYRPCDYEYWEITGKKELVLLCGEEMYNKLKCKD